MRTRGWERRRVHEVLYKYGISKTCHINRFIRTHLRWDAVDNEAEPVCRGRLGRTISKRRILCGDEASSRRLTFRKLHIEENITICWTVIDFIVCFVLRTWATITTAVLNAIITLVWSGLQIVFILKPKQLNIQQHLTLSFLGKLLIKHVIVIRITNTVEILISLVNVTFSIFLKATSCI